MRGNGTKRISCDEKISFFVKLKVDNVLEVNLTQKYVLGDILLKFLVPRPSLQLYLLNSLLGEGAADPEDSRDQRKLFPDDLVPDSNFLRAGALKSPS